MSDFDAIAQILKDYSVPDDVIEKVVRSMWEREEKSSDISDKKG